jgi:hypothetical protein
MKAVFRTNTPRRRNSLRDRTTTYFQASDFQAGDPNVRQLEPDWQMAQATSEPACKEFISGSRISMLLRKLSLRGSVRELCAMLTGPRSRAGVALGSSHGQTSDGARHGARCGGTTADSGVRRRLRGMRSAYARPPSPASVARQARSAFPF